MVSTISRRFQNNKNDDLNQPSKEGRFGKYGGQYVPETLMPALFELEKAASKAWKDENFVNELNQTGFKFINPNAKRTCGCGESFSV